MATAIKSVSAKSICLGCSKEFTKETLDKHAGVCGRCHTKKTESLTPISAVPMTPTMPALKLPNLTTSTAPMILHNTPTTTSMTATAPMTFSPMTSNATQYALPGEMIKLTNMSIEESKMHQAFTLNVRLDNWYKAARNTIPKNNAAVDVVYTLVKPHIGNIDKIPGHNVLNFEKMFSIIHRSLID
jgi:hypothetical protein